MEATSYFKTYVSQFHLKQSVSEMLSDLETLGTSSDIQALNFLDPSKLTRYQGELNLLGKAFSVARKAIDKKDLYQIHPLQLHNLRSSLFGDNQVRVVPFSS
jgi:hypothetical protein